MFLKWSWIILAPLLSFPSSVTSEFMIWSKFFRGQKPERWLYILKFPENPLLLAITGRQAKCGHCSCPELCVVLRWPSHIVTCLHCTATSDLLQNCICLCGKMTCINYFPMYILLNYCTSWHLSKSSCMIAISSKRKKKKVLITLQA